MRVGCQCAGEVRGCVASCSAVCVRVWVSGGLILCAWAFFFPGDVCSPCPKLGIAPFLDACVPLPQINCLVVVSVRPQGWARRRMTLHHRRSHTFLQHDAV